MVFFFFVPPKYYLVNSRSGHVQEPSQLNIRLSRHQLLTRRETDPFSPSTTISSHRIKFTCRHHLHLSYRQLLFSPSFKTYEYCDSTFDVPPNPITATHTASSSIWIAINHETLGKWFAFIDTGHYIIHIIFPLINWIGAYRLLSRQCI